MQKRSIKNDQNVEQNIVIMFCCFMLFAVLYNNKDNSGHFNSAISHRQEWAHHALQDQK